MKRKILLVLAIMSLFACIFAMGVSADGIVANTITSETYGTVYQLSQDPGLDNAKNYASVLNTIEDQGKDTEAMSIMWDGTYYYVFPTSYLVDENSIGKLSFTLNKGAGNNFSSTQNGINDVFAEWNEAEGVNLPTFAVSSTWGNTRINNLVRIVVPTDITFIDSRHCLIKGDELVEVVFKHSVSVAAGLFSGNAKLTTVKGFEMVNGVGTHMFSGCSSLVSIKFPSSVTSIGTEMFLNCSSFTGIENWDEIKDNITSIGNYAFRNCDSLVSISLPAITSIGTHALAYCDNLETVDLIGASFVKLNAAFRDCPKLDGIVLPDTCDGISQDGFHNCNSLSSIRIPKAATYIGGHAFNNCTSLAVVDMSGAINLKSTSNSASFGGIIATELIFPEGFESFGGIANYNVKVLSFPNSTKTLSVIKASITEFRVPLGVTSLCSKQFDYCSSLQSVTLHKGLTSFVTGSNPSFFGTTKTNLKTIYYTGSDADEFIINVQADVKGAAVSFVDQCETYFGAHAWSGNATMQKIDYFKGVFFADSCTREFCGVNAIDDSKTIGALFVDYGYSATEAPINGTYSMSQFYGINTDAVKQYRALNESFEFGFVVAANASPFASLENGELSSDKIFVTQEKFFAYDYVSVSVGGISDGNKEKAVAFCMFVKDNGNVSYLDNGETVDTIAIKSYADILTITREN